MRMSWNYKLVRHFTKENEVWYGVHEEFHLGSGETLLTENPISLTAESKAEMLWVIKQIAQDIERYGVEDVIEKDE